MDKEFDPLLAGWRQHTLSGFVQLVGPLWSRRDEGEWKYGFLTDAKHANPAGVIHGGLLTTLMDHALSAIAREAAGRLPCVTIQIDTHFTRRSSTLVFMQGVLSVEKDDVVTGSAILKIIKTASR
ncbi:MAG: hypothetical protein A3I01_16045 [Betaproteobacteria bacterium RIFCSPLOWO2_02_FULL_65_24]|nr:MAG: hypothetical protein A3I01_16045 [Betaproteobacteria bacterium RIFCSPLOWO2_02_FULL_65_24]